VKAMAKTMTEAAERTAVSSNSDHLLLTFVIFTRRRAFQFPFRHTNRERLSTLKINNCVKAARCLLLLLLLFSWHIDKKCIGSTIGVIISREIIAIDGTSACCLSGSLILSQGMSKYKGNASDKISESIVCGSQHDASFSELPHQ